MKSIMFLFGITLNQSELLGIGGIAIGLAGLGYAIYQRQSTYKANKIYENACKSRCKDAVAIVGELAKNIDYACTYVGQVLEETNNKTTSLTKLNANVSAILTSTKLLIRFCKRLNEEHKDQFKSKLYEEKEIENLLCRGTCADIGEPQPDNDCKTG